MPFQFIRVYFIILTMKKYAQHVRPSPTKHEKLMALICPLLPDFRKSVAFVEGTQILPLSSSRKSSV
jgi:hypothetical protein